MPISDRTRKLLWGHSGTRCAICRQLLVVGPTVADPAAIVGEECHILARSTAGPRGTASPDLDLDSEENLILLCRVDHKRVDDQPNYYTPERLRAIKLAHESWVHATLSASAPPTIAVRIRRDPTRSTALELVLGGSALLDLLLGAEAYDFAHDDLKDEQEVEQVASFLQMLHDYGECGEDLSSGERVRARFELGKELNALSRADFLVYAGTASHVIEGGVAPPAPWRIATVRIRRLANVVREAQRESDNSEQAYNDGSADAT